MNNSVTTVGDDLTYKIIGCAMRVHQVLGGGFQEVIYQRCLAIEMKLRGLTFEREKSQAIYYTGQRVGTRRADFTVEEKVIIETKAVYHLEDVHLVQAKNYVVAYKFPRGLLLNFGGKSLEYKLLFNDRDLQN